MEQMIPSYLKIKLELENMIESKKLKIGEKLPSEYEMANYFNVSRETFRSAVKLLEQEGKLLVKHGVGTFVIEPLSSIASSLEKLQSMSEIIRMSGLKEGESKETIVKSIADEELAKALDIREGDSVVFLERVRTANEEPVALTINAIPYKTELGKVVYERSHISGSLFKFMEQELNIHIIRAVTEIRVPLNNDNNLPKLQLSRDVPILLLKQIHYDERNKPIFYSMDYLRNDIFNFWIKRERID